MTDSKKKPKKVKKLPYTLDPKNQGYIASGSLFIGDPTYLSGKFEGANPFADMDQFLEQKGTEDFYNLGWDVSNIGRGIILDTPGYLSGKYIVKRKINKLTGKIEKISITFKD
jgi:hypothetical protein